MAEPAAARGVAPSDLGSYQHAVRLVLTNDLITASRPRAGVLAAVLRWADLMSRDFAELLGYTLIATAHQVRLVRRLDTVCSPPRSGFGAPRGRPASRDPRLRPHARLRRRARSARRAGSAARRTPPPATARGPVSGGHPWLRSASSRRRASTRARRSPPSTSSTSRSAMASSRALRRFPVALMGRLLLSGLQFCGGWRPFRWRRWRPRSPCYLP